MPVNTRFSRGRVGKTFPTGLQLALVGFHIGSQQCVDLCLIAASSSLVRASVEVRMASASGVAAHVDETCDVVVPKHLEKAFRGPAAMADGVNECAHGAGPIAMPHGVSPAAIVVITSSVSVSTTATSFEGPLAV